jgi:predicted aspartyl protease
LFYLVDRANPGNTIKDERARHMKYVSFLFLLLLALSGAPGFCQQGKAFRFPSAEQRISIPFELSNNHIYVWVRINDSDSLSFLFDNGAGSSGIMIDSAVAAKLGLEPTGKISASMTGGNSDFLITDSVSLQIGGLRVFSQKAAWFHLKEQEAAEGHRIDGILSYSFFKYFVFEIDYKNRVLAIIAPEAYNNARWKQKIPLVDLDKNRVPIVSGMLVTAKGKRIPTKFTIDTGHDEYLVLGKRYIARNGLSADTLKRQPPRLDKGLGGDTYNRKGRIGSLSIGSLRVGNPDVLFSFDREGFYAGFDGALLGGRFFKNYKLVLNYPAKYLVLTK